MRRLKEGVILCCLALLLCSCTMIYDVTKIPRTPENLQALRECQRTAATAVGYSEDGFWRLKKQCYSTLENITTERVSEYPQSIPGCQLLEDWGRADWREFYFLCKP